MKEVKIETNQKEEKNIKFYLKKILNYLVKTTNGMAYGLFATLIVGVVFSQLGKITGLDFLNDIGTTLKSLMGIGIGIGIATSLNLTPIQILAAGVAGAIGASIKGNNNPVVCYVAVIGAIEIYRFIIRKKTPVDIILIPLAFSLLAYGVGFVSEIPLTFLMTNLQQFINYATEVQPFLMGIIIAVVMGMCLTAPISSAAIAIAINLSGIAGGAAVVGCSVQMIGFAIMSIKDNNIGKVISVGIGTSMLQFKNILKKPIIWIPTILTSAILGPISTLVFKMESTKEGSGMGTCGLVGQFSTFEAMGTNNWQTYLGMILLHFVLPAILVFAFDLIMRRFNLIKKGDLEI